MEFREFWGAENLPSDLRGGVQNLPSDLQGASRICHQIFRGVQNLLSDFRGRPESGVRIVE